MKKKNLAKKLQLKKILISDVSTNRIVGGLPANWTGKPTCDLTTNCTEFPSCINCITDLCTRSCRPDICTPITNG